MTDLEQLADLFDARKLTRLEYEEGDVRVVFERQHQEDSKLPTPLSASREEQGVIPASAPDQGVDNASISGHKVVAPLVGVLYHSREPGSPPFVTLGQHVDEGDTLCLIEAMKLFSEIQAPASGIVREILFEDGALAEFGMHLFTIG
jgi:acetyl-CoA carboxylase biotin carboxyl carrier protein